MVFEYHSTYYVLTKFDVQSHLFMRKMLSLRDKYSVLSKLKKILAQATVDVKRTVGTEELHEKEDHVSPLANTGRLPQATTLEPAEAV